jgi:hypothetical protein
MYSVLQINNQKYLHLVGCNYKIILTMHGYMNIRFVLSSELGLMKGCVLCFIQTHLDAAVAGITRVTFLPLYGARVWKLGLLGTAVGFQADNLTSFYGAGKLIDRRRR